MRVVINLAQELLRKIETNLENIDLVTVLRDLKNVLSKHVDVLLTYTLEEHENTDSIISMLKAATALFQRTLLITDTSTFCRIISDVKRTVTRGGISVLVLDYGDSRDNIPEDQLIIESTGKEVVRDVKKSIEISESLEEPVIIRLPLYSLIEVKEESIEDYHRTSGLFYRDWKIRHAWITGHLVPRESNLDILNRITQVIVHEASSTRIVVDYQLYEMIRDIVSDYTVISPKIYTLTSLKKIVNRESDIVVSTSKKVTELSVKREYIDIAYKCLEKYIDYVWKKNSRYLRPLLTLLYTLLNIYRDQDVIVCSDYIIPVLPSKGKYDIRLVTRVPVNIFDVVDIALEDCISSLKIFEDKLPKNFSIICITDDKMLIRNLDNLLKLDRSRIIILIDDVKRLSEIISVLKLFNIKFMILEINNFIVDNVRKLLKTDVKVIIVLREYSKSLKIVRELCDRCGNCVKIYCDSIRIAEEGVLVNFQSCVRCHACVIACTRGAVQLSEEPHNQLQTQCEEDPALQD